MARTQHLKVGDVFIGEHGLARGGEMHFHSPYHVVGVLAPSGTVIDRLALTDTASVWKVHEHENAEHAAAVAAETQTHEGPDTYPAVGQEITAVLVRYRSADGGADGGRDCSRTHPTCRRRFPRSSSSGSTRCSAPAARCCADSALTACLVRARLLRRLAFGGAGAPA